MGQAASLWVKLGISSKEFDQGLKKAENDLKKFGDRLSSLGSRLTVGLSIPLALASGAAIKFGMDAVESENLFEVSMGKMSKSAREWSEGLRKELGLNAYEVRKNVGTFNVMLDSMGLGEQAAYDMAKGLTQLSYDMASFYNLKPEEAFLKLQSGISGEVEPLKRLGIIVNETTIKTYALNNGLIKQGEELSEAGKVAARYGAIMEQTAKAQGDLARTIDSPTNRLRILQEQLKQVATDMGIALLPAVTNLLVALKPLAEQLGKLVQWFAKLPEPLRNATAGALAFTIALGPLTFALGKVMTGLSAIPGLLRLVSGTMAGTTTGIAAAATKFGVLAGAVGLWIIAGKKFIESWENIKLQFRLIIFKMKDDYLNTVKGMMEAYAKIPGIGALVKNALKDVNRQIEQGRKQSMIDVLVTVGAQGDAAQIRKAITSVGVIFQNAIKSGDKETIKEAADAITLLQNRLRDLGVTASELPSLEQTMKEMGLDAASIQKLLGETQTTKPGDAPGDEGAAQASIKKIIAEAGAVGEQIQETTADIVEEMAEIPKTFAENWSLGLKYASDSFGTWADNIQSLAYETSQAMANTFDSFFNDVLDGNLKSGAEYINSFLKDVARQMAQFVSQMMANNIMMSLFGGMMGGSAPSGYMMVGGEMVPARANGGSVNSGQSYLVGERGPELFTPGASGAITPNHALGGGNLTVKIVNPPGVPMKATEGETKFDGKQWVKTIVMELTATDPTFRNATQGAR